MRIKKLKRRFFTKPTLKVSKDLLGKYIVRKIGNKKLVGKIVETEAYIGPEDKASHAYGGPDTKPSTALFTTPEIKKAKHIFKDLKSIRAFLKKSDKDKKVLDLVRGKLTQRNRAEWLIGGHIYIYLVYGMYWQLNISTGRAGSPECVLIRALEPVLFSRFKNSKSEILNSKQIRNSKYQNPKQLKKLADGPGKLCRWLKLDKSFYGEDVTKSKRLWIESRGGEEKEGEERGKRESNIVIAKGPRIGIDYAGPIWARKRWRFWIKNNPCVSSK